MDVGYRIPSGVLRQDISLLLIFRLAHRNKSKLCILLGSQNANQETEPIFMMWSGRNCLILQKRETLQEVSACKLFFADRAFSHNQPPRLKPSIQRTFQRLQIFRLTLQGYPRQDKIIHKNDKTAVNSNVQEN